MRIFYELENDDCVESVKGEFIYYDNIDVAYKHKLNKLNRYGSERYKNFGEISQKYKYSFKYFCKTGEYYIREYIYDNCVIVRKHDGNFTMCSNLEEFEIYMMIIDDEIKKLYY